MQIVLFGLPTAVNGMVARACAHVSPHPPVWLRSVPRQGARPNKCAFNVKAAVDADGGEAVFGWKVEVWQRILVKFIGHSV